MLRGRLRLNLSVLARAGGAMSLSTIYAALTPALWLALLPNLSLVAMTLLVLELVENSRIPVDDPTTHLELTMIHEVMVLDHGGPDLALIEYGAALKLWATSALLASLVVPIRWREGSQRRELAQHLSALRRIGLVSSRREGTSVFYSVEDGRVFDLLAAGRDVITHRLANEQSLLSALELES